MTPDISLIIPFLNEEENIPRLVSVLNAYLPSLGLDIELIFVDDGSTDQSLERLKQAEHRQYTAKIISLSKNYGSHAALRAGILKASGCKITFLSADLQNPVELIGKLYHKSEEGYDVVWAEREKAEIEFVEKVFSKSYAWLMRKFAVSHYPQNGYDVVLFNTKVQNVLNQHIESNSSLFLQILTLGFRCASISYRKRAREAGQSKWTVSKKIKLLIDSFIAFSYAPIRLVSLAGISLAMLGFLWAVYLAFRALLFDDLNPGWPLLISTLMMGFGVTNISLGIIAEYLWRSLDVVRKRDVFIINEVIELTRKHSDNM